MAKLFKTISLEDRWKASVYNNGPVKPMSVEQGSIDIKAQLPSKDAILPLLRKMPDPIKKTTDALKITLATSPQAIQTLKPFDTKFLTSFAIPLTNTKFRSAISLADRLSQPNFGSTTHLAQYFLADQYTDYIKITPFGIFNHTSDVVIQPISFIPQHGGNNPTVVSFNALLNQGVFFSNGLYYSNVNVNVPSYDSLLLQGATLSNNTYVSVTSITLTQGADSFIINPNITPSSVLSQTAVGYAQGIILDSLGYLVSGITTTAVMSAQAIAFMQGIILDPSYNLVSFVTPSTPITITPVVPSSIVINNSVGGLPQGGTNPTPISFEPNRTSPVLNVLFYEAQRALAFFTPRVIHGSADLSSSQTIPGYFQNTTTFFDDTNPNIAQYSRILRTDSKEDVKIYSVDELKSTTYGVDQRGGLGISAEIGFALGKDGDETNILDYTTNVFNENIPRQDGLAKPKSTGTNYSTLTYDQILARVKTKDENGTLTDFRSSLSNLKGGNGKAITVAADALGVNSKDKSVNVRGVLPKSAADDFITLKVASMRDGASVLFRAFITSFSDSVNVSWNDINYVGRQDTLKAFKGVTRGGSIAFKVAALCEEDMSTNYAKLNSLVRYAGIGKPGGTAGADLYIRGPLCKLTVGKWFTDTPIVFNSIKFDVQMAEYSWDIDKQVPQLVDVSMDFVVLGDVAGKPLGTTNNYFNYKG